MDKPYYQDNLATVWNKSTDIFESDVVILDPPGPLMGSNKFKAKTYIIFCGSMYQFYIDQFPLKRIVKVFWDFTVPDYHGMVTKTFTDMILLIGDGLVPGRGLYPMKPIDQRYGRWERPEALLLNLIGETNGDVLDPFCGSGASLVASKKLGKKSIGFDIDKEQCKFAAKRLKNV